MDPIEITLRVNGKSIGLLIPPDQTLLEVLREELSLYGARNGCGIGICGACTVLVEGRPISSCLTLAFQVDGKDVLTIEGMQPDGGALHPIQQAFLDHHAFQCSYCTPGLILAVRALLRDVPNPDEQEIKNYLAGNLCRCGSYQNIQEAVMSLASNPKGENNI